MHYKCLTYEQSLEAFDASLELYTHTIPLAVKTLITFSESPILINNFNHPINLKQNNATFKEYLDLLANKDNTESLIAKIQNPNFISKINLECHKLLTSYISLYDIKMRGIDNYKVQYFMGIAILNEIIVADCNNAMEKQINTVVVRLMLLIAMQLTLQADYQPAIPQDMFKKTALTLMFTGKEQYDHKGTPLDYYFGKHGLYTLFKTVAKITCKLTTV